MGEPLYFDEKYFYIECFIKVEFINLKKISCDESEAQKDIEGCLQPEKLKDCLLKIPKENLLYIYKDREIRSKIIGLFNIKIQKELSQLLKQPVELDLRNQIEDGTIDDDLTLLSETTLLSITVELDKEEPDSSNLQKQFSVLDSLKDGIIQELAINLGTNLSFEEDWMHILLNVLDSKSVQTNLKTFMMKAKSYGKEINIIGKKLLECENLETATINDQDRTILSWNNPKFDEVKTQF
jgi:hypothetical protein